MIDYLKVFERSSNLFPGFETEIQGVYREVDAAGAIRAEPDISAIAKRHLVGILEELRTRG